MNIKFTMNVERYGDDGVQESTVFNLPMRGTPLVEFNITAPQKDGRGRAQVTRYIVFNHATDSPTQAYSLLSMGEDHGVPVFAYRYAMDATHLAEHLSADGLAPKFLNELGKKLGVQLPAMNDAAEQHLADVICKMLSLPQPRHDPRIPALLQTIPKKTL